MYKTNNENKLGKDTVYGESDEMVVFAGSISAFFLKNQRFDIWYLHKLKSRMKYCVKETTSIIQ